MQRLLKETNDMNDNNDMFSPQTQPTQSFNELELHVAQEQHMHQFITSKNQSYAY